MAHHLTSEYRIPVDRLRPGVFIRLEATDWFSHPFLHSSFKINDMQQVEALRLLGIAEVVCVPEKSAVSPLSEGAKQRPPAPGDDSAKAMERLWRIKKERVAQLLDKRRRIARFEESYVNSVRGLENIMRSVLSGQSEAVGEALALVRRLSAFFLKDTESTLHLMNVVSPSEHSYSHPLNVTILAMLLGTEAGLSAGQLEDLGLGALFHDIGKERVEKKLLKRRGLLSRAEQKAIAQHVRFGLEVFGGNVSLPRNALAVLAQHHEYVDGSGYPDGLRGGAVDPLARMVSIANDYDMLCNNQNPARVLTPYQALSAMYTQHCSRYDESLLGLFIRCMGVYPPGTVVQLSNGSIGMVMSVNSERQLAPNLVLYDPGVPRREALIIDLSEEQDLSVEKSVHLSRLPQAVSEYLSPRSRITYYVKAEG